MSTLYDNHIARGNNGSLSDDHKDVKLHEECADYQCDAPALFEYGDKKYCSQCYMERVGEDAV